MQNLSAIASTILSRLQTTGVHPATCVSDMDLVDYFAGYPLDTVEMRVRQDQLSPASGRQGSYCVRDLTD